MSNPVNKWKISSFKPGQNVQCTIIAPDNDGYKVSVVKEKENIIGFLKSAESFRIGEQVLAQYVGFSNGKILLSALVGQSSTKKNITSTTLTQSQSWQDQLNEIDKYLNLANVEPTQTSSTPNQPKYTFRRAIDYITPPLNNDDINSFRLADYDIELLVSDLEGGMRTGCVKFICDENMSRSAILFYRGRAFGAIYSSKEVPNTPDWEEALKLIVDVIFIPSTEVMVYDLPQEIVLPLTACFQGFTAPNDEQKTAKQNLEHYANWFKKHATTGLFAFVFNSMGATFLIYVYKGDFKGLYLVEEKKLFENIQPLYELLENDSDVVFQASAIAQSLIESPNKHGLSLSMTIRNKARNI